MQNTVEPIAQAEPLEAVVEDAYRAFGHYKAPRTFLDVCLNCCMPEELEREMRQLPLRQLTTHHFYRYNDSAKSNEQPPHEILYLLPRMLELLAAGETLHHSTELYLDRVGRCPDGTFDAQQERVLDRFALSYFAQVLRSPERLFDDPLAVMLMFDIGGRDTTPLMDWWTHDDGPRSTMHFVDATYWDYWPGQDYTNAFATDRHAFRVKLREWLSNPAVRRRFADRLASPEFLRLADEHEQWGRAPFQWMVDAVFDHLTQ